VPTRRWQGQARVHFFVPGDDPQALFDCHWLGVAGFDVAKVHLGKEQFLTQAGKAKREGKGKEKDPGSFHAGMLKLQLPSVNASPPTRPTIRRTLKDFAVLADNQSCNHGSAFSKALDHLKA
jgi:hypothetical protein